MSAEIPRVSYEHSTLRVGGALWFRLFDGTVRAENVEFLEPFGKALRLRADLQRAGSISSW